MGGEGIKERAGLPAGSGAPPSRTWRGWRTSTARRSGALYEPLSGVAQVLRDGLGERARVPREPRGTSGTTRWPTTAAAACPPRRRRHPARPRRQGGPERLADGLANKAGTPGLRPGAEAREVAAVRQAAAADARRGRAALFEQTMRSSARPRRRRRRTPGGAFWRVVFAPVYARIPWGIKQRIVADDVGGEALEDVNASAGRRARTGRCRRRRRRRPSRREGARRGTAGRSPSAASSPRPRTW